MPQIISDHPHQSIQACSFNLEIVQSVDGIRVVKPQDKLQNEDQHNHNLSVEEVQLIAEGRRSAISDKTVGNNIPQIRKTLSGRKAVTIMSYMDLYNWRQEVEKTKGDALGSRSDVGELFQLMETKGHLVSAMIDQENKLACIFFMHPKSREEIKRRGEVLAIDATYKVNNLDMFLISVQSVSNLGGAQLSTVPIAYGIAARGLYLVPPDVERPAPVIVTDKSAALMAAIRSVFPTSTALLCTWHIFDNFKKNLSNTFEDKTDKDLCMNLVRDMINSRTEEQFQEAHKKYQAIVSDKSLLKHGANDKVVSYFNINWEPIKHMWAGYLTKEFAHFGCTTTQRVEGSHAVLKRSVALSSRTSLASMFDIIHTHVLNFFINADQLVVKEGRMVDALVRSAPYMQSLIGKVSAWALVSIHANALKAFDLEESAVGHCHCVDPIWFAIPCQHQLLKFVRSQDAIIPLSAINQRWHLHPEESVESPTAVKTGPADVNVLPEVTLLERFGSMHQLLQKLELAFRNCKNLNEAYRLEDCINRSLALHEEFLEAKNLPTQLPLPGTVPKLGRPSKKKHIRLGEMSSPIP